MDLIHSSHTTSLRNESLYKYMEGKKIRDQSIVLTSLKNPMATNNLLAMERETQR